MVDSIAKWVKNKKNQLNDKSQADRMRIKNTTFEI